MTTHTYIVPEIMNDTRIDKMLSSVSYLSRNQVQKAIKNEQVSLNNSIIVNLSTLVKQNDKIVLDILDNKKKILPHSKIALDILYEDNDLIIINKSNNMVVHPPNDKSYNDTTLVNALKYHTNNLSDIGGTNRAGIVHRLDKNTSGLMVIAKNNFAHEHLANQLRSRTLVRKYMALVWGIINPQKGVIDLKIGRSKLNRMKMTIVNNNGKNAVTYYKTIKVFNGLFSLVECKLETGRTHQIRVHLSYIGNSIVGDQTYGHNNRKIFRSPVEIQKQLLLIKHQLLYSYYISFIHPSNKKLLEFNQKMPKEFLALINFL